MMTDAQKAAFNQGYLIACCNIENLHGATKIAADVLAESGITRNDVRQMDLSEYDAEALRLIRLARADDPISN